MWPKAVCEAVWAVRDLCCDSLVFGPSRLRRTTALPHLCKNGKWRCMGKARRLTHGRAWACNPALSMIAACKCMKYTAVATQSVRGVGSAAAWGWGMRQEWWVKPLNLACMRLRSPIQVLQADIDLLNPPKEYEQQKHKRKRLVQSPNSFFMDVK